MWEMSVPSSPFCCEFKSALKIVFIEKKEEKEGKEEGEVQEREVNY